MPRFSGFNTENKLRIPLSSFAAQIIENDQHSFSQKKTTLINTIILNFYQIAECTISLRLQDYQNEIKKCLSPVQIQQYESVISSMLSGKSKLLSVKYSKRQPADVNWQITLNKRVKEFLTQDDNVYEEQFYGDKPGRYVRALLEEYAQLPFHLREEIVYKEYIDIIQDGIDTQHMINIITAKGTQITIHPIRVTRDPLSMYHYLVGYKPADNISEKQYQHRDQVMSIRISRISNVSIRRAQASHISTIEMARVERELSEKTVQFVSGDTSSIKVWLSDEGIQKYNSQIHLRPNGTPDPSDYHIYNFECTEVQILYYFISFGKHARIISPEPLVERFKSFYHDAMLVYDK